MDPLNYANIPTETTQYVYNYDAGQALLIIVIGAFVLLYRALDM